jgi:hypothetical protein
LATKVTRLSAADVCVIIESCSKHGVSDLSFGDLKVTFKGHPIAQEITGFTELTPELQEVVAAEVLERDELKLKQELLERMMVEDPVEYENMLTAGDLTDSMELGDRPDENDRRSE